MTAPLEITPRPKRKPRLQRKFALFVFLIVFAVIFGAGAWLYLYLQSNAHVPPFDGRKNVIVFQGQVQEEAFAIQEGQVLLPLPFVQKQIDPAIFWDEPTKSVIVTTKDKVLRMESDKLVAFLNKKPIDLHVPVQQIDGIPYVPYEPLSKLYAVQLKHIENSGVTVIEKAGYSIQQGKIESVDEQEPITQPVRKGPSGRDPIVADLNPNAPVDIIGEEGGWYRVQTADGIIGFMPKSIVTLSEIRKTDLPAQEPKQSAAVPWKPLGQKINLTWEHVTGRNPKLAEIPAMPGLNVVSPTWFELTDDKATLGNKADSSYVKWAHQRGYQVWGLVSNGFNPDFTKALLSDFHMREKFIVQVIHYATMYELDGINLDFENVYIEDKARLVQLVRELTPYLHEQNLTVSMDVTPISTSDRWSRFYDRKVLAQVVDYMAVMTYDEHWGTSPVAGSVASLPWVEESLQNILQEVPRNKLLLGVPFYTRLWKEVKQPDGSIKVTSKALYMSGAQKWIKERNLKPALDAKSGQYYVSYTDPADKATYKIWIEDQTSMAKRIELVRKYNLAGVASWRRGFETPDIWNTIQQGLQAR
ncbi:glycosyl hydrolase family 18 protein [Brevibacillus dissolubilis]|uniref:glycosyl hydrolase family 18 protein n=1 Tax=Brevibacillus dissolubilis TaxID=1844116 RepID=UPI0011171DBD|nr:glycosyl hydrolase family 18 protein [Brevibacillus dissolubilis]